MTGAGSAGPRLFEVTAPYTWGVTPFEVWADGPAAAAVTWAREKHDEGSCDGGVQDVVVLDPESGEAWAMKVTTHVMVTFNVGAMCMLPADEEVGEDDDG